MDGSSVTLLFLGQDRCKGQKYTTRSKIIYSHKTWLSKGHQGCAYSIKISVRLHISHRLDVFSHNFPI